jgi:formylglycine-generating enzyme required for sulfatase activity
MLSVPIAAGGTYCIDNTEVFVSSYATWLALNPTTTKQPAYCSWNTTFVPSSDWPSTGGNDYYPVHYVDWCDALAYCTYYGKRLCSRITTHGHVDYNTDYADPTRDEWMNACDDGSTSQAYPYTGAYDGSVCSGSDKGLGYYFWIPESDQCIGGIPFLYDMSGSLSEWEDSCDAYSGSADHCLSRGGGYTSDQAHMRCDAKNVFVSGPATRNTTDATIGFRCCGG